MTLLVRHRMTNQTKYAVPHYRVEEPDRTFTVRSKKSRLGRRLCKRESRWHLLSDATANGSADSEQTRSQQHQRSGFGNAASRGAVDAESILGPEERIPRPVLASLLVERDVIGAVLIREIPHLFGARIVPGSPPLSEAR